MATFTYELSNNIGLIRLRLLDNNESNYIFSDEDIQAYLDTFGTVTKSLIQMCHTLYIKYNSGLIKVDDITIDNKVVADGYLNLAKALEDSIISGLDPENVINMHFGGVYESEITSNETDRKNDVVVDDPFPRDVFDI